MKKQATDFPAISQLILRALKDIKTAEATLDVDEGIAYAVIYLGMLRAGRASMLLKGFRPSDGAQHRTVVEFTSYVLGSKFKTLVDHFDKDAISPVSEGQSGSIEGGLEIPIKGQ